MNFNNFIIKKDIIYYDNNIKNNSIKKNLLEKDSNINNQKEKIDIYNNIYKDLNKDIDSKDSNINKSRLIIEIPFNSNLPTPIKQSKHTQKIEPQLDIYNLAYISYIKSKNQNYKFKLNNIDNDQYKKNILLYKNKGTAGCSFFCNKNKKEQLFLLFITKR